MLRRSQHLDIPFVRFEVINNAWAFRTKPSHVETNTFLVSLNRSRQLSFSLRQESQQVGKVLTRVY
jgi:hypothetical protein